MRQLCQRQLCQQLTLRPAARVAWAGRSHCLTAACTFLPPCRFMPNLCTQLPVPRVPSLFGARSTCSRASPGPWHVYMTHFICRVVPLAGTLLSTRPCRGPRRRSPV
jgi:hypothetical protein